MTFRWTLIFITIFSIISQPFALLAQQTNDWAAVRSLSLGQEVRVETKAGRKIDGSISSVSDEKISMAVNGANQEIGFVDVKKVYSVKGESRGTGVAIGAAIGAGAGLAIGAGANASRGGSDDTASVVWPFVAIGAGVGALAGAFLRRKNRTLIYEAR